MPLTFLSAILHDCDHTFAPSNTYVDQVSNIDGLLPESHEVSNATVASPVIRVSKGQERPLGGPLQSPQLPSVRELDIATRVYLGGDVAMIVGPNQGVGLNAKRVFSQPYLDANAAQKPHNAAPI